MSPVMSPNLRRPAALGRGRADHRGISAGPLPERHPQPEPGDPPGKHVKPGTPGKEA
jgi:hypothetical protein